jgi:hypothetical protein
MTAISFAWNVTVTIMTHALPAYQTPASMTENRRKNSALGVARANAVITFQWTLKCFLELKKQAKLSKNDVTPCWN